MTRSNGESLTDAKLNLLVAVAIGDVTAVIPGQWHVERKRATPAQTRALNWLDGSHIERKAEGAYVPTQTGLESLRLYRNWR